MTALEERLKAVFTAKNLTIATAESCTSGLLAGRITEVSGERFRSRARALVKPGWRSVLANGANGEEETLPALRQGESTTSGV